MNEMTTTSALNVARPLSVLVPLIKEDLKQGNDAASEAAQQAGLPYYRAAGVKMIEAKGQMPHGAFSPWIERNFKISDRTARKYMGLARTTDDREIGRARSEATSLNDYHRRTGSSDYVPNKPRPQPWHEPVQRIISHVDLNTLNLRKAEMKRAEEREAQRTLALQLIDIGYKALATKLHPDRGGSRDAMARLNAVRDRLRQCA